MRYYAGVGARKTPPSVRSIMTTIAEKLGKANWYLISGGAQGADEAFRCGAPPDKRTIFLPWNGYNNMSGEDCHVLSHKQIQDCLDLAEVFHPAWQRCKHVVRLLHARNVAILLGPDAIQPVDRVICWTEGGKAVGGTGMAIRIAEAYQIPIVNLAHKTLIEQTEYDYSDW